MNGCSNKKMNKIGVKLVKVKSFEFGFLLLGECVYRMEFVCFSLMQKVQIFSCISNVVPKKHWKLYSTAW